MKNLYDIADKSFQHKAKTFSVTQESALEAIAYHEEQLEISKITHSVFQRLASRAERGDNIEDLRLEAVTYLKARKEGLKGVRYYA